MGVKIRVLMLLALLFPLTPGSTARADEMRIVSWVPGPGSETYFRRVRENSTTCRITQNRGPRIGNSRERVTLFMELDCRYRPTGGRVMFESFLGRSLVHDWRVSAAEVVEQHAPAGTRVEWVERPLSGSASIQTRVRLVATRGKRVSLQVNIIARNVGHEAPPPNQVRDTTLWCDAGTVAPPIPPGDFNCSERSQCNEGYICSPVCGNACIRRQ